MVAQSRLRLGCAVCEDMGITRPLIGGDQHESFLVAGAGYYVAPNGIRQQISVKRNDEEAVPCWIPAFAGMTCSLWNDAQPD